jgi:uncharacterized protein YegJ (DUF2314 family)
MIIEALFDMNEYKNKKYNCTYSSKTINGSLMKIKKLTILLCGLLLACQSEPKFRKVNGEYPAEKYAFTDVDMNNVILLARKTLNQFDQALTNRDSTQTVFAVKALFDTQNGGEHIWLTEIIKKGGQYSGIINNVPEATREVKLGDTVLVTKDRISDWMYIQNGKLIGGYTIRVTRNKLSESGQKLFDEESGFIVEN